MTFHFWVLLQRVMVRVQRWTHSRYLSALESAKKRGAA